ncbi:MAG TPA: hypothetical protein VLK30_08880 [Candidatus Limnocylindrales bacterium]|nr:hypothetical protein [Candidatus Limnocylindrales bacterium]
MADLEQELSELAAAIAWPPTPNLSGLPHLWGSTAAGGDGAGRRWGIPRWSLAAAAALLIVAVALAYTPSRNAIADFLNLHTTVHRVQQLPTPTPLPSGKLGVRLGLGTPTTLGEAQARVAWRINVPPSLGRPDEVYLQLPPRGPSGGEVTLVYASRPGIKQSGFTGVSVLVTEARGQVNEQFFGKTVGPGTTIETVSVNGHTGWWIAGAPHQFIFTDGDGNAYFDTLRLATNTLIIDDAGTIVRIEGQMTKDQALGIAASL